jgi:hypothetical protein
MFQIISRPIDRKEKEKEERLNSHLANVTQKNQIQDGTWVTVHLVLKLL